MIRHYVKLAARHLVRHKAHTLVSLLGLSIGLAACTILTAYIQHEWNYDRCHPHSDRTFRVVTESESFGPVASSAAGLTSALQSDYPEVESVTRVFRHWFSPLIHRDRTTFIEENFFFADSTFFDVFGLSLIQGDARRALQSPFSVVISRSAAARYFGEKNPIGEFIAYNTGTLFRITGLMNDAPTAMHFHPDFVASIHSTPQILWPTFLQSWGLMVKTYVVLRDPAQASTVADRLTVFYNERFGKINPSKLRLQPVTDIHLYSTLDPGSEFEPNNDIRYLYLLGVVVLAVLVISIINYVNLSTARAMGRTKEAGVRKILGAGRRHVIVQLMLETAVVTVLAAIIAMGLVELLIPLVRQATGENVTMNGLDNLKMVTAFVFPTALISGWYPAIFLSGRRSADVFLSHVHPLKGHWLRKSLLVFQFTASVVMAVAAMVIGQQMAYIQNAKTGFQKEHVVVIPVQDESLKNGIATLARSLKSNPRILEVGAANAYPGKNHAGDYLSWGVSFENSIATAINWVDERFIPTMGMDLVAGREFRRGEGADEKESIILNQSAVKAMGLVSPEEAVGKVVLAKGVDSDRRRKVIGIVRDFNFESLHHPIGPIALIPQWSRLAYAIVRIQPGDMTSTLAFIQRQWETNASAQPFVYRFLDEEFDRHYRAELHWGLVMNYGTLVAVLLATLGIVGLVAYSAQKRAKEIGIRKVLGASTRRIVGLLSWDFLRLALAANVIGLPLAYLLSEKWLQRFSFRIDLGPTPFATVAGATVVIILLAVGYQSLRAASVNPVEVIRYE